MSIRQRAKSAFDMSPRLITVLYGNPNVGKTILANRTTREDGSCVILTTENGHMALKDFPELAKNTEVITAEGIGDITEIFGDIFSGWQINGKPVRHLMLDTFSGLQEKFLDEHMDVDKEYALRVKRNHPLVPVLQDYNLSLRQWRDIMARLAKQQVVDVSICCHVAVNDNILIPRPAMSDKVFHVLNGAAQIVGFMRNVDGQRWVTVRSPKNEFAAKSQLRILPDTVTDDDFVRGINKWRETATTSPQ